MIKILRPLEALFLIVAVMFLMVTFSGCDRSAPADTGSMSAVDNLRMAGLKALNLAHYDEAFAIGDSLLKMGEDNPRLTDASIYGNIIMGQASIFSDSLQYSYPCLHEAEALCIKQNNDSALASVYNGLGLYSSNIEKDNNEALRYYFLGLDAAKRSGNERLHSLLLCNIAVVYYLTGNPMGLRYAMECYNQGKLKKDEFLRFTGSITTAYSYLLREDYEEALRYIKEAEVVMHTYKINDGPALYSIYGMILRGLGRKDDAVEAFRESISHMSDKSSSEFDLRSYIELSDILVKDNQIGRAIEVLDSGLVISDAGHDKLFRADLLDALARVHRLAGNRAKAEEYERIRRTETDSVDNFEKDIAIERIRAKYDLERVENELNRQRVELLEKQNMVYILVSVVVIIAGMLLLSIYFYRRKNRLYAAIVTQMTSAVREETRLRESIRLLEEKLSVTDLDTDTLPDDVVEDVAVADDTATDTTDESADNENMSIPAGLYKRLQSDFENLLLDKSIYTDNLLNKDKIARHLGTNRTYLSRFVNLHYKMSFTQLINTLRIKEAIRLLSDPTVDTPLKTISEQLGYNSQTTFYTKFNEATGMTPAAFRNKARQMSK